MFEYKLLPLPPLSKKAKGRKTVSDRFTHALSECLNEQAKDNWVYVGQESFTLDEKSGLMGKEKQIEMRTMIFRREVGLEEMPLDKKLEKLRERKSETMVQAAPIAAPLPEPFPEPMPSPQALSAENPMMGSGAPEIDAAPDGDEPTRIFSPFSAEPEASDAPALGPARQP